MTDERIEAALAAWLKGSAGTVPDADASARAVLDQLRKERISRGGRPFGISLRAAAVVVVVVAGAALAWGPLGLERTDLGQAVGAPASSDGGQAPVHWTSPVIDLQAESVELRIGDEVFTGAAVDVVDASGYTGQFMLRPMWTDERRTIWLSLDFVSDETSWSVWNPWLWLDGRIRPNETEVAGAAVSETGEIETFPPVYGDNVDFERGGWIERPLGQAYEGDWLLEGQIEVPMCGSRELETIDVTLLFEDLRLTVTPREPTFIEGLAEDWFHRGSMLGDLVRADVPRPEPAVMICPEPAAGASSSP